MWVAWIELVMANHSMQHRPDSQTLRNLPNLLIGRVPFEVCMFKYYPEYINRDFLTLSIDWKKTRLALILLAERVIDVYGPRGPGFLQVPLGYQIDTSIIIAPVIFLLMNIHILLTQGRLATKTGSPRP